MLAPVAIDAGELESLCVQLRAGSLRGETLRARLLGQDDAERDEWIERLLGIRELGPRAPSPERELIGYQPSGVGALLRLIDDVPITARDELVDVGSGLGKVTMLVHLLTAARCVGLERDGALLARAEERAAALRLDGVRYVLGDARELALPGTVYFMYAPVTGGALARALVQLQAATRGRHAVVCTLGLDLAHVPWLRERPGEDLFTSIYDCVGPG
jgi:SAM-dependent methyltransferase